MIQTITNKHTLFDMKLKFVLLVWSKTGIASRTESTKAFIVRLLVMDKEIRGNMVTDW